MSLGVNDLHIERCDGTRVVLHVGDRPVELDAKETRWLMRKLGEALLKPCEPTEPVPALRPMRSDEVMLVRKIHRASWARDLEDPC